MKQELTAERRAELEQQLRTMQAISDTFYRQAVVCGVHAFIEFTGFMNEYIKICRENLEAGIDYSETDTHSVQSLDIAEYQADYLGEKFNCIFGNAFKDNPKIAALFWERVTR